MVTEVDTVFATLVCETGVLLKRACGFESRPSPRRSFFVLFYIFILKDINYGEKGKEVSLHLQDDKLT